MSFCRSYLRLGLATWSMCTAVYWLHYVYFTWVANLLSGKPKYLASSCGLWHVNHTMQFRGLSSFSFIFHKHVACWNIWCCNADVQWIYFGLDVVNWKIDAVLQMCCEFILDLTLLRCEAVRWKKKDHVELYIDSSFRVLFMQRWFIFYSFRLLASCDDSGIDAQLLSYDQWHWPIGYVWSPVACMFCSSQIVLLFSSLTLEKWTISIPCKFQDCKSFTKPVCFYVQSYTVNC